MTTTTRNEIAEQVLVAVQMGLPVDWKASLYAVAAAERLITVKRIRARMDQLHSSSKTDFLIKLLDILDEEAAR